MYFLAIVPISKYLKVNLIFIYKLKITFIKNNYWVNVSKIRERIYTLQTMIVEWKKIPGFTDYEISNEGKIRSRDRIKEYKSGRKMNLKSKEKKLREHPSNGFLMTDLIDNKGKRKTVYPHKAVALAFIYNETPRKRKVVIHIDGNVKNNSADNLKWASFSESIKIGFDTGKRDNSTLWEKRRAKYGPKGGNKSLGRPNPLKGDEAKEMFLLRKSEGLTLKHLAEKFGCSISHVHKTIREQEEKV